MASHIQTYQKKCFRYHCCESKPSYTLTLKYYQDIIVALFFFFFFCLWTLWLQLAAITVGHLDLKLNHSFWVSLNDATIVWFFVKM